MALRYRGVVWGSKLLIALMAWTYISGGQIARADLPRVEIVIGEQAPAVERYAADELKAMLERLYQVRASIGTQLPKESDDVIFLGQDSTNSQLHNVLSQPAEKLSDQGLMLQTLKGRSRLILRGGSSVASLWAVYELGERLGIQYLSDRDVYPTAEPTPWKSLPDLSAVMEPNLRIRCWRLINEHAMGPASWSLEENQRFMKQLAKMKFNRILVQTWPTQPFIQYSFQGIPHGPGVMFFGARFPIDENMIGRERFGKMTVFTNPEFVGAVSDSDLQSRAQSLLHGIIHQAKDLGMEVDLGIIPTQWPKKYMSLVPGAQPYPDEFGDLTCGPGPKTPVDDPALSDIVTTVVRASIDTYPDIDFLRFEFPELPVWYEPGKQSYEDLAKRYDLSVLGTFDELCAKARARSTFPGGGQRVERSMCESLVTLDLIDNLIRKRALLKRPGGGPDYPLILSSVTDELIPLLPQLLPPGGEYVAFIDYTASRQLKRVDLLHQPSNGVSRLLSMTLGDDNVGVLPQLATPSLHKLLAEMRTYDWSGFSTRYWNIAEQDPAIHYLSRACWDKTVTPQQAYTEQVLQICGPDAVQPALEAFSTIEQITLSLDQHGLGFGFPIHNMMKKHADTSGLTDELKDDRNLYQKALEKMKEAKARSKPSGAFFPAYFVARLNFAVNYMDACDEYGVASAALKAGNRETAREHAASALKAIDTALQTEVDVAHDHGELGAVATMQEYCRKPILELVNTCDQKN